MRAKAAIVSVFALMLAAAAVCGEQYRLQVETVVDDGVALKPARVAMEEVDVTN